ncbi:cytochrome-c peroxidase [Chloroflexota bacterium]
MVKTKGKVRAIMAVSLLAVALILLVGQGIALPALTPIEELGQNLYFDEDLSEPSGQSCASCHEPDSGFVDPDSGLPVSEGVIAGRFGDRNSPSAAYAMFAPIFYFDDVEGLWIGGQFWDGRATGEVLGDPLADQALGPFLNEVEMNNPDKDTVIRDVAVSDYAELFDEVWGAGSLDNVETAYNQVALSIAAFERTELFAPFTSKYDAYLQACLARGGRMDKCAVGATSKAKKARVGILTDQEWRGMQLFMNVKNNNDGVLKKSEGAMCAACHVADWTPAVGNVVVPAWAPAGMVPPVFTDFTFDNLGVPKNKEWPLDANAPADLGLGDIVNDVNENGKFKVMGLRNIEVTGPYAHNGLFKSLDEITHFYNTRDVPAENWDPPEVPATINVTELGNLGLSAADEAALVAFMKTLTDSNQY